MLSRMARIAIIGGGSIGEALLSGLLRAGRQVKDLVVAEKDPARAKYLSEKYSVLVTSVADAVDTATYVIVAVKPADVEGLVGEIADAAARAETDTAEQVFVTVAAGVTTAFYENKLPAGSPVIRVMPNAPDASSAAGSARWRRGRFATAEHLKEVSAIFDAVGGVLTVPESQIDAVTAVSGSGPAYFFLMVEALVDAGVAAGLTRVGGHRSGRADDGGFGGDAAGAARRGAAGRGGGDGHGDRHHGRAAARDSYLAGGHHRRWSAGTRARRFAGSGRRRRSRPQKPALSS